jgi:tRNA-modifying protein YgfZ
MSQPADIETSKTSETLQSLRERAVLVEGPGHDILRATGNDRVTFLHRITSGKVAGVEPGQGSQTLLLDVRGRVLARLLVFVRGKSVRIIVPAGQGESVAAGLSKFAIMDDFQLAVEPELASLAVLGPRASEILTAVGVTVSSGLAEAPLYAHAEIASDTHGPLWAAHGRACGVDGLCVVATRSARDALVEALVAGGVPRLPGELAEVLRIAALEPKAGNEITPDRFPVEIGLGAAIDHTKGCYVGQETIVRMRDRGNIRKRLVLLRLSGADLPRPGDKLTAEGQPAAGVLTSAAGLPGEAPVALAIVAMVVPVGGKVDVQREGGALSAEVVGEVPPWG